MRVVGILQHRADAAGFSFMADFAMNCAEIYGIAIDKFLDYGWRLLMWLIMLRIGVGI
jgi:hypothetical protein